MVRKPTRQGKTAILTFPGEDGAAAAALLLAADPLAEVYLSSKNAIAGVLANSPGGPETLISAVFGFPTKASKSRAGAQTRSGIKTRSLALRRGVPRRVSPRLDHIAIAGSRTKAFRCPKCFSMR
jgi:hypothetical protein